MRSPRAITIRNKRHVSNFICGHTGVCVRYTRRKLHRFPRLHALNLIYRGTRVSCIVRANYDLLLSRSFVPLRNTEDIPGTRKKIALVNGIMIAVFDSGIDGK